MDGLLWFGYPKKTSKKYTSDIDRDHGWKTLECVGFNGIRLVSIDEDWSALRFRNIKFIKSSSARFENNHLISFHVIKTVKIDTPLGFMVAGATEDGVCLLEFSDRRIAKEFKDLTTFLKTTVERGNKHLQALRKQLYEYFAGNRKDFQFPLYSRY